MQETRLGIALRSSVVPPSEIVKFTKMIDQSNATNVFINESSPDYDALEICSAALGVSKGLLVGTGVIRLLEHDESLLARRLKTLQSISNNRFVLGVGTGSPGPNPDEKIKMMLQRLDNLRTSFNSFALPKTFIATLRSGIAKKVAGSSDGIILNFCTPEHASRVIKSYKEASNAKAEFACYLKVFYSKTEKIASKLLIEEFRNYSTLPQYRKMFEVDGILSDIESALSHFQNTGKIPQSLLSVSLANPSESELKEYITRFRNSGVTLPCIYPYFGGDDNFEFRTETIRSIVTELA